jgi:CubicO group peptidase (beta-lactamase class C family)
LWLLALCLLSALCAPFASAQTNDSFARTLDERMPGLLVKYGVPGAVVSCISNGDVAWTKAFGLANLKTGAPMRPEMIFNHGSNGKALTMWGIMRLVEQGKVDLDAPVNRYLKRWQLRSSKFDPAGVTVRRLLTHTAGLTVHGFMDYDQRRTLPSLVEILEGRNQIELFGEVNGPVFIRWQPGSSSIYSGGGYVLLQMLMEDVTGEPFGEFMKREVVAPLGLHRLEWVWNRDLENAAPMTYGELQEEVGYRQLACYTIGSELCTVPDFARFVAAFASGPQGEPPGRGVLKPESIETMLNPLPGGLSFGFSLANMGAHNIPTNLLNDRFVAHSGRNTGWCAYFLFDTTRREGFVVANNSLLGLDLGSAVERTWLRTALGVDAGTDPPPGTAVPMATVSVNHTAAKIAAFVWAFLVAITGWCAVQIARGKRRASRPRLQRCLFLLAPPLIPLLAWWYLFYAPDNLPLPLPTTFLSIWRLPLINYITALLSGWFCVAFFFMLFPRTRAARKSDVPAPSVASGESAARGPSPAF